MAAEQGRFDIGDVIYAITEKLIRRHPHIFGPEAATNAGAAKGQWDRIKADERATKAEKLPADAAPPSLLDDVPNVLPALARAEKLSRRAASVGFDWPDWRQTLSKVREELDEIQGAVAEERPQAEVAEEIGDLLFAAANLARQLGVDAEAALRDANLKFTRRFNYVEARAREDDIPLADAGLARLDGYWNEIRDADKRR
jgi:MazG family protein